MIQISREPITAKEATRLDRFTPRGLFRAFWRKPKTHLIPDTETRFVEVYKVSVERCFVPLDFNEELPLYLLDLGGAILILFGQWVFDPHTLVVPTSIFEAWACQETFFAKFCLRSFAERGTVTELTVEDSSFVKAEPLGCQVKFKRLRECLLVAGHSETLLEDLRTANLLEN